MVKKQFDFSEAYQELERIVASFEDDSLDLDKGLQNFEKGVQLAQQLKEYLHTVENKVEKVKMKFAQSDAKDAH